MNSKGVRIPSFKERKVPVLVSREIPKFTGIRYKRRPFVTGMGSIVNLSGDSQVFSRYLRTHDAFAIRNDWQMVGIYIRESFNNWK